MCAREQLWLPASGRRALGLRAPGAPPAFEVVCGAGLHARRLHGLEAQGHRCEDLLRFPQSQYHVLDRTIGDRDPSSGMGHDPDRRHAVGGQLRGLLNDDRGYRREPVQRRRAADDCHGGLHRQRKEHAVLLFLLLCVRHHGPGAGSRAALDFDRFRLGAHDELSGRRAGQPDGGREDRQHECQVAPVFGTGPTSYIGASTQTAQFIVVRLATGPDYTITHPTSGSLHSVSCTSSLPCDKADLSTSTSGNSPAYSTGDSNSFMGDVISVDSNLDFRVDAIYAGNVVTNSTPPPTYRGKMYRLATTAVSGTQPETFSNWGILSGSNRVPTVLLAHFAR